ncbi:hypothetical protein ACFV98_25915 [Streptomyces violascens]|uniref:hypothetical protein n=1 Tax=Streptomyces violascens TaxID=67381 RepID=UPI00366431F1
MPSVLPFRLLRKRKLIAAPTGAPWPSSARRAADVERARRRLDPAFRRVNLEILGNTDGFLHAHVWPRFDWEPADLVHMPVWLYPHENWRDAQHALAPRHDPLREEIARELDRMTGRG